MQRDKLTDPNREKGQVDIAVVIPALNEEKSIGGVIDEVRSALGSASFEILIVDGHSVDKTREIATSKGARVIFQRTRGYGDALRSGFLYVYKKMSATCIVMMDADLTYNPTDIPSLATPILQGTADMVIGNRLARLQPTSMTRTNQVGNRLISWVARATLGLSLHDTQCGLRAFRTTLVDYMNLEAEGMPFATEMIVDVHAAKGSILEVPVSYRPRTGVTKLSPISDGLSILATLIRLLRDTRPLLFFLSISSVFGVLGLYFGFVVLEEYLQSGTVTKIPTLFLSVLLLIGSMQMFTVGLIADMLRHKSSREHL